MDKVLKVHPSSSSLEGTVIIPPSKPETQRAIVTAALAQGMSKIRRDLRCSETAATKSAVESFGAVIEERENELLITGVANSPQYSENVINCDGSGFAFRTMCVIASFVPGPVVLTGDQVLQKRIMNPLYNGIRQLGGKIAYICNAGSAPIVNFGREFTNSQCTVPGDECSQFTTAFLLGLPLANHAIEMNVTGNIASGSYVKQTIEALKMTGVDLNTDKPSSKYVIEPAKYQSFTFDIGGDYTSASYIIAIAALFKSKISMRGLYSKSYQGERAIVNFVRELGLEVSYDDAVGVCTITNHSGQLKGDYFIDVRDCPNILPTLAAIGSYIDGSLTVTGGSVTNFHKSPRIQAMVVELKKLGVDIQPYYVNSTLDGFIVKGQSNAYEGGKSLLSWGDHRIFLSLFIVSLRSNNANLLEGYKDVHCSFPDFFAQMQALGLVFEEVQQVSAKDKKRISSDSHLSVGDAPSIGWV